MSLRILSCGPGLAVQDLGRPGWRAAGLTQGGAADRLALYEGAALLGQPAHCAAIEMVGFGGVFRAERDVRIALTGASMRAAIDGAAVPWNACHALPTGSELQIGPSLDGTYGYLHVGGGFETDITLGARSAHLSKAIGQLLAPGQTLPVGSDPGGPTGLYLPRDARFSGGTIRMVASMQTNNFTLETRARFEATTFQRAARANRQGAALDSDGPSFALDSDLTIVSEAIAPGDIQITGDGTPFVLLAECHTTGGYPRIGTVIPADIPKIAQTPAGGALQFCFISFDEAIEIETQVRQQRSTLPSQVAPLIRAPDTSDLLANNLISGISSGTNEAEGT